MNYPDEDWGKSWFDWMPEKLKLKHNLATEIHHRKNTYLKNLLQVPGMAHPTKVTPYALELMARGVDVRLLTGASHDAVACTLDFLGLNDINVLCLGCSRNIKLAFLGKIVEERDAMYIDDREDIGPDVEALGVQFFHYDKNPKELRAAVEAFVS